MKLRAESLRDLGACLSPFNAFLFLQGLETLSLRMDRHVANAQAVAAWLERHPAVERVRYAGLRLVSVPRARAALPAARRGLDLRLRPRGRPRRRRARSSRSSSVWSHLANVGDAKSLVIHPASTTHRQLSDEELAGAGIGPGTIRLSVGIETIDDLIWDLEQALGAVGSTEAPKSGGAGLADAAAGNDLPGPAHDPDDPQQREDGRDRRPLAERAAARRTSSATTCVATATR